MTGKTFRARASATLAVVVMAATSAVFGSNATAFAQSGEFESESDCVHPVVLVHDIASRSSAMNSLREFLAASGYCTYLFTYGRNATTELVETMVGADRAPAGLAEINGSADEFESFVESVRSGTGADRVDVVAHGAGSLVAQRSIQKCNAQSEIRSLITIGPMWNGTNIAGLGTIEDLSRRIGTYDAILRWETPIIDPLCAGCRQIITGSDFLASLHADGLPTAGVRYTDVVSEQDLLVVPPFSGEIPGMNRVILQHLDPENAARHFSMIDEPVVHRVVADALGYLGASMIGE